MQPSEKHSQVVYRKTPDPNAPRPQSALSSLRGFAPALWPLIIGFLLLLGLISGLGIMNVRRMDEVGFQSRDLALQRLARLNYLLELRLKVTRLDNEARLRGRSEAGPETQRRELLPPFEMRLNIARDEVEVALERLMKVPPLSDETFWLDLRNDLQPYIETTKDARTYSLEGFEAFSKVDKKLNQMFVDERDSQNTVLNQMTDVRNQARRQIIKWIMLALLVGALVAVGTIWQVQRQFRELRRSTFEARRERTFTSQLLEGMVSAVAAIDENDRIRSANAAFFQIFPGASIGASVYEKLGSDGAMKMLEAATSTRVDRSQYRGRWATPPSEGQPLNQAFDIYSSTLAINGSLVQIVTLEDVSEAAGAERDLRRQESLAAVGQATAQVAHEIRNPLGSIRLGVAMLRDNVKDEEGLNTIDLVERGIKHLNKLVVDVAQFSRRKALETSDVDLHEVISRSLELVADRIKEKDTVVKKDFLDR